MAGGISTTQPSVVSPVTTSGGSLTPAALAGRKNALLSPDGIGFGTTDPRKTLSSIQGAISNLQKIPESQRTPEEKAALQKATAASSTAVQGIKQLQQQEQQFFQSTMANDEKQQSASNNSCSAGT